jgi:hypothetical protein
MAAALDAKIPQAIPMVQIGGEGAYYPKALTSGGAVIHTAGAAVAKSPATLAAGDVTGNIPASGNWNVGKTGYSLTTAPLTAQETANALQLAPAGAGAEGSVYEEIGDILADTTALLVDTGLVEQWILNKTVLSSAAGTIILYAANGTTPLKTWVVTDAAGVQTRNAAT